MHKAYASAFTSYLLKSLNESKNIKSIILFGSAARGEATKESDIDLFVEVENSKKLEKEIDSSIQNFYSTREYLQFKAKGIENQIHVTTGKLSDWKELKSSIESTGIILFGQYSSSGVTGKKQLIFSWDKIGKNRGSFLNKLYGFKVDRKRYPGLIEKLKGKKLGKSTIMTPVDHRNEIFDLIKKHKVNARILEVYC